MIFTEKNILKVRKQEINLILPLLLNVLSSGNKSGKKKYILIRTVKALSFYILTPQLHLEVIIYKFVRSQLFIPISWKNLMDFKIR